MIRVLHLVSSLADFQTQRCVQYLTHDVRGGLAATLRTIGPGGDFFNAPTAALGMQGWGHGDFDVVHAWGPVALAAATLAGWRRIIYSPPPEINSNGAGWVWQILRGRKTQVVVGSDILRRMFMHHGIGADRCRVIRPAVDVEAAPARRDARMRASLGFEDSDFVLLVPGETTEHVEHRQALWTVGILNTMDNRCRSLFWGRGPHAKSLGRFAGRLLQENLFTSAENRLKRKVEFEELTSAADAVVIAAKGSFAALPIFICMAAGLPIVAGASPVVGEFLEDGRTALIVPDAIPRTLAQRIIDLRADPALQHQIGDNARRHVRTHKAFSIARFLSQWEKTYETITAGDPAFDQSSRAQYQDEIIASEQA